MKSALRFPWLNLGEWLTINPTSLLILATFLSLTLEGVIDSFILSDIQKSLIQ